MTTSIISKELAATVAEKLETAAAKLVKGLTVSVDTEVEPKEGYFGVTVYFENAEQAKAIAKAKLAIAKQVAAGTLGQAPAATTRPRTATPEVAAAAVEPLKPATVKRIVSTLAKFEIKATEKQVADAWAGKPDAKFKKIYAENLGDTVEEFNKKKIHLLVALLVILEFTTKDASLTAAMESALKKAPKLFESFEEDEEDDEEDDEEVTEADDDTDEGDWEEEDEEDDEIVVQPAKSNKKGKK